MKPIFNILAIGASCAGIFFSLNLSKKFDEQQQKRVATLEEERTTAAKADATDKENKDESAVLASVKDKRSISEQTRTQLTSKESATKRELAAANSAFEAQKGEFDQLDKAMAEVKKAVEDIGADLQIAQLPEKVKELEADKTEKQKKSDELATLIEGAQKKLESLKAENGRMANTKAQRDARIRSNALESVVTAVNQDWGFVVVGAGSNTGFTPQTKLLVERDGRRIGMIQPTSIEPTQTIANIDFDSIYPGVRLQPGDRVILAEPATN